MASANHDRGRAHGPRAPDSTVLTAVEEAMIVEFRRRTLLPLGEVLRCRRDRLPKLTQSSLHRCLDRHGIRCVAGKDMRGQAITHGLAARGDV
jgi:hypothetical protein